MESLSPEGFGVLDKLDKEAAQGQNQAVEKAISDAAQDVYEYEGKRYTAHPAAALFPLIEGGEFDRLMGSLKLNGMRHPIVLLGDQIVDGRNRFRAALKAGVKILFTQMNSKEDPCAVAMDLNVNRRDLGQGLRVAMASMLRRLAIRLAAIRREELDRVARERREKESAAAQAGGSGESAGGASAAPASEPPDGRSEPPAVSGAGGVAELAEDVEGSAAAAAGGKTASPMDKPTGLESRENAAKAAGVSSSSLKRFDKVVEKAPELQEAISQGRISVSDAAVVSEEDPELRRQALDDVREGRAKTGAKAIEARTGRAPKARARPRKSAGAAAPADGDGAGLPPLPTVGGAADGKGASGAAAPASAQPSRAVLAENAMSPQLLLAGVRKVMPVINLDPCSSQIANGKVRALQFFTREDDACQKAWDAENVYVFPPPKFAGRFGSKLMGEILAGRVSRALFFAPSDLSDQDEVVLLRSDRLTGIVHQTERTSYDVEGGGQAKAPTCMVLYVFGIDRKELYSAFDPWGKVFTVAGGR